MQDFPNTLNTLKKLPNQSHYYSLPSLEEQGIGPIRRLPISIRILLESLLRNCDGNFIKEDEIKRLANWNPIKPYDGDLPFIVSRVLLQDFTGVPLLVDLAMLRDGLSSYDIDPALLEPNVPVDLVIDHSVQVDEAGTEDAFLFNLKTEMKRNLERYSFLEWGQKSFKSLHVIPPGIGICHQVNLEYLASVVVEKKEEEKKLLYPDSLVGTDSHTTMINGLGIVGWGVGGIEAEAAMLGQPVFIQTPEVIGVHLSGKLLEGVTATDLTLYITELLRKAKVVDKFIEFFGEGVEKLSVADRATIANMAPEYGATMGLFPIDEKTLEYLRLTGRKEEHIQLIKEYYSAQGLFGVPKKGDIDYTNVLELDLTTIRPSVSGPKRPQDRIELTNLKDKFQNLLKAPLNEGGYSTNEDPKVCVHASGAFQIDPSHTSGGTNVLEENGMPETWSETEMVTNRPALPGVEDHETPKIVGLDPEIQNMTVCDIVLRHGSVAIAAITSCTNTSNPSVMIAAGLLAKKAVEKGLKVNSIIKTSLAPGSRVVTDYLVKADLQRYLDTLGFQLVAYGCTTCIGNSGPLEERVEKAIKEHSLVSVSVLSGNRNFEARINSSIKANFLMSPPLVVAFAIAGRINIDMEKEPLGKGHDGNPVFLRDVWPTTKEIEEAISVGVKPEMFQSRYSNIYSENPLWDEIGAPETPRYPWDPLSSYIQCPPFIANCSMAEPDRPKTMTDMRSLAIFGDSVTTDHISPAGAFRKELPAGKYLIAMGVKESNFNSYGSRRGNYEVMTRGTFANVRIRNKMVDREGGYTKLQPEDKEMTIYEASQVYLEKKVPLMLFAGKDYGMGSSRDWAAKGTALLGVKAVVAESYERIHRSNLIGMGVLPLQFLEGESAATLGITGNETFSLSGLEGIFVPHQEITLEISDGKETRKVKVLSRLDTPSEVQYYRHGGILPFIYRKIVARHLLDSGRCEDPRSLDWIVKGS
ncbi:MAG: aconitate hydratase [Parachlamydiaceae bacterium]|nr:aconitate hydratase [Parachlamydiaceae bacterium]